MATDAILVALLAAAYGLLAVSWWAARRGHALIRDWQDTEKPDTERVWEEIHDIRNKLHLEKLGLDELGTNFELLKTEVRGEFNKVRAAEERVRRMVKEVEQAPVAGADDEGEEVPPWLHRQQEAVTEPPIASPQGWAFQRRNRGRR